ncbi:MAG: Flp family type IVb pilin [Erythrobacter sp.]
MVLFQRSAVHQPQAIGSLQCAGCHKLGAGCHVGIFSIPSRSFNLFLRKSGHFDEVSNIADGRFPMRLIKFLKHIGNDSRGATAVEYGLIVSLVVLAMLGALQSLGGSNGGYWDNVQSRVGEVMDD